MDNDWSNEVTMDSHLSTMIKHADLSRQLSNVMIMTNASAVFFYTIGGLILRSMIHKNNRETATRELPIKMEFPFNVDNSPIFELVFVAQLFHDLSVACIIAMLNALLVTLVSFDQISYVFDIVLIMLGINHEYVHICLCYSNFIGMLLTFFISKYEDDSFRDFLMQCEAILKCTCNVSDITRKRSD